MHATFRLVVTVYTVIVVLVIAIDQTYTTKSSKNKITIHL